MNKKAAFDFTSDWAEFFFLVLLFIGLIIGILSPSAAVTYLISGVWGFMAGRLLFERKGRGPAPYILIIIGFIMGFVIGSIMGERWITLLIFLGTMILSYNLYLKKIIKDIFV
jgi:hypothetical protein